MRKTSYFRTSNFYHAAFLFAKGISLANIDRLQDPKRAIFVFVDQPDIEALIHAFHFSAEESEEVKIDARKMVYAIKTLKDKLYQS